MKQPKPKTESDHTRDRIRNIVKIAVREYDELRAKNENPETRFDKCVESHSELDGEIIWTIELIDVVSSFRYETQLVRLAMNVYTEIQEWLKPASSRKFFGLDPKSSDFFLEHSTPRIMVEYLINLPHMIHWATNRTLRGTIIGFLKRSVEPHLKEADANRKAVKLTKADSFDLSKKEFRDVKFALLPVLDGIDRVLSDYSHSMLQDKKIWFSRFRDDEKLKLYQEICERYRYATRRYKSEKATFHEKSRRKRNGEWLVQWAALREREFPDLRFTDQLDFLGGEPAELGFMELSFRYDYAVESLRRQIKDIRQKKRKRINEKV